LAIDAASYNVEQYKSRHSHTILHKAVSSKDGELVKLKKYMGYGDDDTNSGNFSITGFVYDNADQHGFRGDEYEEVETISLETILDMVGDIGLLKIDIEGAEVDVLCNKDLSKINYITGEFHNFIGKENQSKLFGWISNTHNEIYSVGDGVGSHFIKMWKRK
jgi:FkbM family methyltransferase